MRQFERISLAKKGCAPRSTLKSLTRMAVLDAGYPRPGIPAPHDPPAMQGFTAISIKLKEIYQLITLGGDAELGLVDSMDPFSKGIVFSVRPPQSLAYGRPKKRAGRTSPTCRGETLCSLSLKFALHAFRGAPLCVMARLTRRLTLKTSPCRQLHQGAHQKRPVPQHLLAEQHV